MGGGSGIPSCDIHSIVSDLAKLANIINDSQRLGLSWLNNGGGGSPIQGIENVLGNICARLDDLSSNADIAAKALNRFVDAMESLPLRETPVRTDGKRSSKRGACPLCASKEDRHSAAPDVAHTVHMNADGKLGDKIE